MWATLHPDLLVWLPQQTVGTGRSDWEARLGDLERYRNYTDDWDGQGAAGIGSDLIDSAVALAAALRRHGVVAPASALPGVQGTVGFEWDLADGGSATLEVLDPNTAELFLHLPGEPAKLLTFTQAVTA
jgi:hypothetical protein